MSKVFRFCLTIGVDGYLPDQQDYFACDCSIDAFDAITDAVRMFVEDANTSGDATAEFDWRSFFERGCAMPDASTWSFQIAHDDTGRILSLTGMTEAEYNRETGDMEDRANSGGVL